MDEVWGARKGERRPWNPKIFVFGTWKVEAGKAVGKAAAEMSRSDPRLTAIHWWCLESQA